MQGSQSFLKFLFIGTPLETTLKRLSLYRADTKGLKPQEYEHGSRCNKQPIPNIPQKDKLQEAIKISVSTINLILSN